MPKNEDFEIIPEHSAQIPREMDILRSNLADLEDTFNTLRTRVAPTYVGYPIAQSLGVEKAPEPLCQLAEGIREVRIRIADLRTEVDRLSSAIEL